MANKRIKKEAGASARERSRGYAPENGRVGPSQPG